MIFSNKSDVCGQINIRIDGEHIQALGKTKFLGVIIDKNLTWKDHILCVFGKIGLGMIIKARYLDKAALMSIHLFTHIQPIAIRYGTLPHNKLNWLLSKRKPSIVPQPMLYFRILASSNLLMSTYTLLCYSCFVFITIWFQTNSKWCLIIIEIFIPMLQDSLINFIFQWLKQI